MTQLLDANVLVALAIADHVHHDYVHAWLERRDRTPVATCPITQGALLRVAIQRGATHQEARALLEGVRDHPDHEFWADDLEYTDVRLSGVIGHRQVTDAYLAGLARRRGAGLVTFDGGLVALHPDVAVLVPRDPPLP